MDLHVETVKNWLQDIFTGNFEDILLPIESEENKEGNLNCQGNLAQKKIKDVNAEEDEIVYADGSKYFGGISDNLPQGNGQHVSSSGHVLKGLFIHGYLEGTVVDIDPQDGSIMEVTYSNGEPHGTYRHKRLDGQCLSFGKFCRGVKTGSQLIVGTGGNSYYFGHVDSSGKLTGECVYLYPCLKKAIVGHFSKGRLSQGQYRTLSKANVVKGFIELEFESEGRRSLTYDPSTFMRISRTPLETDEYEDETVYVNPSTVDGAGEGLFARRRILAGELVSLFSGSKVFKDSNRKSIKYGDEEWSDFR